LRHTLPNCSGKNKEKQIGKKDAIIERGGIDCGTHLWGLPGIFSRRQDAKLNASLGKKTGKAAGKEKRALADTAHGEVALWQAGGGKSSRETEKSKKNSLTELKRVVKHIRKQV